MKKEFVINIVILMGVNLLIKPFYIFGIDRGVQNAVGPDEYGIYFAIFNFTFLFQIINDFGIQNFNNRHLSQHRQLIHKFFPNILTLKLGLAALYLVVIFLAALLSGYGKHLYLLIGIIALNQVLLSLLLYLRSNISGLGYYRTDSFLSVVDKCLMILIAGALLWFLPTRHYFRIEYFVYAQTASLILSCVLVFALVWRKLNSFRFSLNRPYLAMLFRRSLPYALVIFLMTAYTRIDGFMIERMLVDGSREAGIYAAGYRLLDASNMIGFLFAGLLLPMFSRMLRTGEEIASLVKMSFKILWAASITLALASFLFREEIMNLLYDGATPYWGEVMGLLMFSFIAVSGTYIYGSLLTANESLRKMNTIFAIGVILNVGLNLWLIPGMKAEGAALATLVTQSGMFLAQVLLARSELSLRFAPGMVAVIALFGLTVYLLGRVMYEWTGVSWGWRFIIYILVCGILAFVFKMVDISQLRSILNDKKSSE